MTQDDQKNRIISKLEVLSKFQQMTQTFETLTDQLKEGSAQLDEQQEVQKLKQKLKK